MNQLFAKWLRKDARNSAQTAVRPALREDGQGVDLETIAWTKSFVERYGPALRELADK